VWERVALLSFTCVTCAIRTNTEKPRYAIIRFLEKTNNAEKLYSFINSSLARHSTQNVGVQKEFPCAIIFKWAAERQGELGNLRF
jgi:hypothetical protein